jgi:hypothetical protein
VAEEWLAKREREGLGDVTLGKAKWLLEFAYARGEYWEERVAMMQAWSDYRDDLARNPRT